MEEENKLDEQQKKIDEAEKTRKTTCEKGTPGKEIMALCDTMKKETDALNKETKAAQEKIDKSRKELMLFNLI